MIEFAAGLALGLVIGVVAVLLTVTYLLTNKMKEE